MTEGTAAMAGVHAAGEKTERNIVVEGPGRVAVRDEPRAPVPAGAFRVTTVFSGISAGTELSYVKGTNPFLSERWDPGLGLFVPGEPNAGYPVTRLGYMEVGTVAESRTPVIGVGGTVAMTYGHRTGYTGDPVADRVVPLPEDLDPLLGIYVAHMGPICANGLLHAAADLCGPDVRSLGDGVRGRRVVVVGAGVVALLTALLTRRHGAASVVVLDPTPGRRAVAEALGLESLDPEGPNDAAASLKTRWRHAPGDRGADVVFQCRGQPAALHLALRVARPQATVIDLAFYQGRGGRAAARRGVPPQRPGGTVRPDRPGAAGPGAHLGPGTALRRDDRPSARGWHRDPRAPDNGRRPVRGRAGALREPGRAAPARIASRPGLRPLDGGATPGRSAPARAVPLTTPRAVTDQ